MYSWSLESHKFNLAILMHRGVVGVSNWLPPWEACAQKVQSEPKLLSVLLYVVATVLYIT